eukprot:TRINITY_DN31311_c0_g1_i1.p1 TRINITY_DN31311_c0_g1~~TRINITY_DN31311_c0_g1_i1.p1  ORF type:complete len:480 (-),score=152.54 TRINITY_DN31311_c0_g1_i1:94-1533(-)
MVSTKVLLIVAALVAALAVVGQTFVWRILAIGTGVTAKRLCSSTFIAKFDAERIRKEELGLSPLLQFVSASIDHDRKTVTAELLWVQQTAVFRDGIGCVLLPLPSAGLANFTLPNPRSPLISAEEVATLRRQPWPAGDALDIDSNRAELKIDGEKLDAAVDDAFAEFFGEQHQKRTRAVAVVYKGELVAERYANGITKDSVLGGWSITKSVLNALVGIRVLQGKMSVDSEIDAPEWNAANDPRDALTVDHLLRMSSGLSFWENYSPVGDTPRMLFVEPDAAAFAANTKLASPPDNVWSYSSGESNILSRRLKDSFAGDSQAYWAFPYERLFHKIGMYSALMETDAAGTFIASSFGWASARDWARFGLLFLNGGKWEGELLLPDNWVQYTATPTPGALQGSYGAHWWLNSGELLHNERRHFPKLPSDAFFAHGFEGQIILVIPSQELVIVRLGATTVETDVDEELFLSRILDAIVPDREA